MNIKKIKFIIICGILTVILATLMSNYYSFTAIEDACVDPNTGNVSIVFYDTVKSGIKLKSFNNSGEQLFSKFLDSDGGSSAYLEYDSAGNLFLYISRVDKLYLIDTTGEILSCKKPDLESEQMIKLREKTWNGWEKSLNKKMYSLENKHYCYEESSFFPRLFGRGKCKFYILDNDNEIVLY